MSVPTRQAIRPSSSTVYQRIPSCQRGPANSSSRGHSGLTRPPSPPSSLPRSTRTRFHQPDASVTAYSASGPAHSGCNTDSAGPPRTSRGAPTVPSAATSATRSTVPSHGIRGWSQAIQASRRPSGDGVGKARKSLPPAGSPPPRSRLPPTRSRTPRLPSSGTATRWRRTAPPTCASRTHSTPEPSADSTGSAYRRPAGTGGSGVSGTGAAAPGSSRYSRWSVRSANTRAVPAGVETGRKLRPPYSWTRFDALHGAGSTSTAAGRPGVPAPLAACRRTVVRPPSAGRTWDHHSSPPTRVGHAGAGPAWATIAAEMGDGQAPNGDGCAAAEVTPRVLPDVDVGEGRVQAVTESAQRHQDRGVRPRHARLDQVLTQ